jgi:hypothetical protein
MQKTKLQNQERIQNKNFNGREKMRSLAIALGLTIVLVGLVGGMFNGKRPEAQAASSTISTTLTAGTLQLIAPGTAALSSTNLDSIANGGTAATGTLSGVNVRDHRATAVGWSATMSCTNFTNGGNTISVTKFTITPGTVSAVGNSSLTGVAAGSQHTFTSTSDPATLMSASSGNGRGRFNQDTALSLLIEVATVPANYSSTCTETVS